MSKSSTIQPCIPATLGARTARGGEVFTASSGMELIALVGDKVRYPDGSESEIVSGAGSLLVIAGRSAAIIGSELANGDHIVSTLHPVCSVIPGNQTVEGFLKAGYQPMKVA